MSQPQLPSIVSIRQHECYMVNSIFFFFLFPFASSSDISFQTISPPLPCPLARPCRQELTAFWWGSPGGKTTLGIVAHIVSLAPRPVAVRFALTGKVASAVEAVCDEGDVYVA